MRGVEEKVRDIQRLVAAARRLKDDAALFPELVRSSGLSPEGVRKALDEHLEVDVSAADVEKFVLKFADASEVTVVLSANVFVGALRAIACARAKGERVIVRPSSREPAFATALVNAAADPGITLIPSVDIRAIRRGEIHVYGRDETIAKVKKAAHVPVVGHGAGLGVGFLGLGADVEAEAERIASDIVAFDQRGCLSLRVLFVEGGPSRAAEIARLMHRTLASSNIPRGALTSSERAEATRYLDAMTMAGETWEGAAHAVALTPADAPILLPPSGRHLLVRPAVNPMELSAPLASIARFVCAVGSNDEARARKIAPSHARVSAFGKMQKPPFDGHVDLRVKK